MPSRAKRRPRETRPPGREGKHRKASPIKSMVLGLFRIRSPALDFSIYLAARLKIRWGETPVPVRFRLPAPTFREPKRKVTRKYRKDTLTRGGAMVARWAHNPKVVGSSPTPAPKQRKGPDESQGLFFKKK